MESEKAIFGCVGALVLLVGTMVLAYLANGWALMTLWGWFISETFALPALSIVQAIGISIVVGFLTSKYSDTQHKDESKGWEAFFKTASYSIIGPVVAVAVGWIVKGFM
jgi:ABC-type Fe3+ transport system permease subunit